MKIKNLLLSVLIIMTGVEIFLAINCRKNLNNYKLEVDNLRLSYQNVFEDINTDNLDALLDIYNLNFKTKTKTENFPIITQSTIQPEKIRIPKPKEIKIKVTKIK